MAIEADRTSAVLDNTAVDNIAGQTGAVDTLSSLSIDIPDHDIVANLNQRINDSETYWNDAKGFDLKNSRNENTRLHLGRIDEKGLYQHQKQYKENQIFVGEESIVAYVTSQIAGPQVIPAGDDEKQKIFASNLEKAVKAFCEERDLEQKIELVVRNILNKRIGIIHLYYDKALDDIEFSADDPEHYVLDKNAALGANPGFIAKFLKRSPEQLIKEFPDKEAEILSELGIQRRTAKQMTRTVVIRKVYVTHYDDNNMPQEAVVQYFNNLVLSKVRNPNYLYARKDQNLLKYPRKPFIFANLVNYGTHLIDSTTPLEQAAEMQKYLNRRGRQISENADKANGLLVVSSQSGLSKDDLQNVTGDPNQRLLVSTENGQSVDALVKQIQAAVLPDYVFKDKLDARMQVGNLMGAPTDFTGSQADDGDPTLGEVMIKKNQASGRQDLMVRAITRMLKDFYEYVVQMFIVWYTDEKQFVHDAGDGEYDFVAIKRDLIEKGIRVKAGKPANPDRSRVEAIVLKLLEKEAISLLDAYKLLQLDNAQQLYDNWTKQKADPTSLARDALDVIDESEAYVAFTDIMNGKDVEPKDNPSKEFILSLRKLMINDKFLKAKKSLQNKFIKYVVACLDSLEERLALEEASDVSGPTGEGLRPGTPLPDPTQAPQPGAAMPPAGPGGPMPGAPAGMPPVGPPPGALPPMAGPAGLPPTGPPTPSSIFTGSPIPSPGQNIMPAGPGGLPQM